MPPWCSQEVGRCGRFPRGTSSLCIMPPRRYGCRHWRSWRRRSQQGATLRQSTDQRTLAWTLDLLSATLLA